MCRRRSVLFGQVQKLVCQPRDIAARDRRKGSGLFFNKRVLTPLLPFCCLSQYVSVSRQLALSSHQ